MGLYDRIKRSVMQITGKDPEASQDGSLYRYANRKDSLAAQIGTKPFDHFGFQPDAAPPGWGYDSVGAVRPFIRAATSSTATPDGSLLATVYDPTLATNAPLNALRTIWSVLMDRWTAGAADATGGGSGTANAWRPLYKTVTLTAGAAADTALIAAVAATKFDVAILAVDILPEVSATPTTISLVWQDEDNVAVTGHLGLQVRYVWQTASLSMPPVQWRAPFGGHRFISAAAAKQLEVDISGGIGTEIVNIYGMYRQV